MQEHALLGREAGYWVVAAKALFSSIPRFAASTVTVALGTYQHTEVYILLGFARRAELTLKWWQSLRLLGYRYYRKRLRRRWT